LNAEVANPGQVAYRVRLCKAGYGPYSGGSTPSSGYVAIFMLMQVCRAVTVYGFGKVRLASGTTVPVRDPAESLGYVLAPCHLIPISREFGVCPRPLPPDTHEQRVRGLSSPPAT
jgi:hypothetical protein